MFRKNSGIENFQAKEGGSFTVFSKILSSHRTEKTSPGNHSVFQKISGTEKFFMDRGGGGVITIFRQIFCLTVPKYFIGEHFGVSEKIFYRKFSCIRGGASRFCRNFLSHRTETESFVKEPFCFPEIFWYQKNLWIRGGISRLSVKIFMSHSADNFRKGILLFLRKFLVSKSFMDEKGGITFFRPNIFGLTVPKKFVGIPSMFQKIWGIEKFYAK